MIPNLLTAICVLSSHEVIYKSLKHLIKNKGMGPDNIPPIKKKHFAQSLFVIPYRIYHCCLSRQMETIIY